MFEWTLLCLLMGFVLGILADEWPVTQKAARKLKALFSRKEPPMPPPPAANDTGAL